MQRRRAPVDVLQLQVGDLVCPKAQATEAKRHRKITPTDRSLSVKTPEESSQFPVREYCGDRAVRPRSWTHNCIDQPAFPMANEMQESQKTAQISRQSSYRPWLESSCTLLNVAPHIIWCETRKPVPAVAKSPGEKILSSGDSMNSSSVGQASDSIEEAVIPTDQPITRTRWSTRWSPDTTSLPQEAQQMFQGQLTLVDISRSRPRASARRQMSSYELLDRSLVESRQTQSPILHPPGEMLGNLHVALERSQRIAAGVQVKRKLGQNYAEMARGHSTPNDGTAEQS